jgi:hypothetical protein
MAVMKDIEMMSLEEIIDELRSYSPANASEVILTPEHIERRNRLWLWLDVMTRSGIPPSPTTDVTGPQRELFTHPCKICGSDAPFGYGVKLSAGIVGDWYCREHRTIARR